MMTHRVMLTFLLYCQVFDVTAHFLFMYHDLQCTDVDYRYEDTVVSILTSTADL